MNRAIPVPRLGAVRSHAQQNLLPRPDDNLRSAKARHLVTAVSVGGQLDDSRLRPKMRRPYSEHEDRERTQGMPVS